MRTGFAKACINPPYDAPLVGYYLERHTKGILDNLYTRAVAFDDGETKAVIITIDVCYLAQSYFDRMKEEIFKVTKLPKEAIFINCSHTHTGPVVGKDFASELRSSEAYDEFLITSVRDVAVYALSDLCETKIETAKSEAKNISFIRRYRMKDGSVRTNPGVNNPEIDHALGTPNETVKLVKLIREGAEDIFIVNFGTHADCVSGEYISSDYVGIVCETLERTIPGIKCIFLQGFQGDVNHINVHPTPSESLLHEKRLNGTLPRNAHANHMANVIAGAVLSVCSITEEIKADKISYAMSKVNLPSHQENDRLEEAERIWALHEAGQDDKIPGKGMELTTIIAEAKRIKNHKNGPESYPFLLSAIRIGDLVFAGIGGEPFTEIGNRISKASPFEETVLCALTNTATGYIPTTQAYAEGGYEARASALAPGGDDIIVDGMIKLLGKLK